MTGQATTAPGAPQVARRLTPGRVRRFEPGAVAAVMARELTVFRKGWRSTTFSAVAEPTIFLIGFGFGIGAIVERVGGIDYIDFIATGIVGSAALFSSAAPAMYGTFIKRRFQKIYDAILAAPVDVPEIVAAETLWIAMRSALYSAGPLLIGMLLGLDPSWGMLLVPPIAFVTGLGFAAFGMLVAAVSSSLDNFNYIQSGVFTPLLLLGGVIFPLQRLPAWVEVIAQVNPVYHCVELVRHSVFESLGAVDLAHLAALVAFAALMLALAVWRLRPALID